MHTQPLQVNSKIALMNISMIASFLLISTHTFGQVPVPYEIDNNAELTQVEAEYLNAYLADQRKGFDFKNKRVIFVTGSSGHVVGSKKQYFDNIDQWNKIDSKVATGIDILTDEQKVQSGGYDVIIAYWVKRLTKRQKNKIINGIKSSRN
jgi:hypothetical protein